MDTNEANIAFGILLEEAEIVYSPPLSMPARLGVPALAHGSGGCRVSWGRGGH